MATCDNDEYLSITRSRGIRSTQKNLQNLFSNGASNSFRSASLLGINKSNGLQPYGPTKSQTPNFLLNLYPSELNQEDAVMKPKTNGTQYELFPTEEKEVDNFSFPSFTPQDLSFAILYICVNASPEDLWKSSKRFFDGCENTDTETHSKARVTFGNYYRNHEHCSFLAAFGQTEDGKRGVVELRRMNGDAFVLMELFRKMKHYLIAEEGLDLLEEEDDSEDLSESVSSDSEGGDDEYEGVEFGNCEIEFAYDPGLLYMMLYDFAESDFETKEHTMSILASASELEDNRKLMMESKWLSKIKQLIFNQLECGKDHTNAALTRSTCVFLKNMIEVMEIDDDTLFSIVNALSKAMAEWCPGKKDDELYIGCLQSSRQVFIEADHIFQKITENSRFCLEDIEKIMHELEMENKVLMNFKQL